MKSEQRGGYLTVIGVRSSHFELKYSIQIHKWGYMLFLLSFTKLEFILVPISFYTKLVQNGKTENICSKINCRKERRKRNSLI